jgi:hypothetical protein
MRYRRRGFPAWIAVVLLACLAVAAPIGSARAAEPRLFIYDNDFLGPGGSPTSSR